MGLWERVRGSKADGTPVPKISPHTLSAVTAEFARGKISGAQAINAFDPPLDPTEQNEAIAVKDAIVAGTITRAEVDDVWHLVETETEPHDAKAATRARLGF